MALKLGELVAYLRTDNSRFRGGLTEAERDFAQTGRNLEAESDRIGATSGDRTAGGFLARFRGGLTALPGMVSGGFTSMPPMVQGPVLAAAGVVGSIFVAGMSAAILLGLGGGVLAAGILLAAKDPAVAEAWKKFGERAKGALTGFTDAFRGPVARAADTFGDAFERMEPSFTRIGQTMAPIIDKLAPALTDMAEKAMPGIEKAIKASAPLFDKLAEHMPEIGDAVSSFFDSIADSGPGALIFIDLVLSAFTGLIRFWGNGIEFWSNTLEVLNTFFTEKVPAAFQWLVDKISGGVDWIKKKWDGIVSFFKGLPGRIRRAAGGMWDGIKNAFKSAINWIVEKWNNLSFRIPGISVPGLGQVWGGATVNTPNLPYLANGGTAVQAGMAMVGERGKEAVYLPAGAQVRPLDGTPPPGFATGGMHGELRVLGELRVRGSDLVLVLRDQVAVKGGNVQAVIGSNT